MQENNFEKEVRQVMQEFSITPSENLWQQVKADLDEKKKSKRRWWFAAMIFSACLLLPSLLLNDLKRTNDKTANNIAIENSNPVKSVTPEVATESESKQIRENKDDQSVTDEKTVMLAKVKLSSTNKQAQSSKEEAVINQKENNNSIAQQTPPIKNSAVKTAKQFVISKKKIITVSNGEVAENNGQEEKADVASLDELSKINPECLEPISFNADVERSVVQIQPIKLAKLEPLHKSTAAVRSNKSKAKNKGHFEIVAAGGKFSLSDKSLFGGVFNSDPAKALSSAGLDYASGGVGITDTVLYAQSYLKSGTSFSLGLNYVKSISKKTSVSLGAGFRYGNTRLDSKSYLAYPTTSTSNIGYSRALESVSTSNRFYFIDLPIQIQSLIGSGKRLPLYWNAGLQYSYLIHSLTPQYNAVQNTFSSSVLTRNIFGISAGLDVALFKNKKAAFKIGPSLYYSFSKAANKDLYKNMHYHFAGIQVKKSL